MPRTPPPSEARAAENLRQRQKMVSEQLERRGIDDERVLVAMTHVPREEFVPQDYQPSAFEDGALPIGFAQTISQPFTVAYMCAAANLTGSDNILEIGTGSGYGAAVLSQLGRHVVSIERIPELADRAGQTLQRLGLNNVEIHTADGSLGWPPRAPYDAILVTAAASEVPEELIQQLAENGRLIIPVDRPGGGQTMQRLTRRGDTVTSENLGEFAFVPLIRDTAGAS